MVPKPRRVSLIAAPMVIIFHIYSLFLYTKNSTTRSHVSPYLRPLDIHGQMIHPSVASVSLDASSSFLPGHTHPIAARPHPPEPRDPPSRARVPCPSAAPPAGARISMRQGAAAAFPVASSGAAAAFPVPSRGTACAVRHRPSTAS